MVSVVASTAIPLLSATLGPLANVLSIAALVTSWRMCLIPDVKSGTAAAQECIWDAQAMSAANYTLVPELSGQEFDDPRWCYWLNVVSLIIGFIGNFFLLCNFTGRIRYIIALPVTIVCWYISTGILIGITVGMDMYTPPHMPQQTYTQGFWYAVIAACMYMTCSMLLMLNMAGYFLGHYPQHFNLTDSQKTLILQTMLFFIWLAGGAAVFYQVETIYGQADDQVWSYVNALYFCDVTILTVGFGDLVPTSDLGRGLVFPFSVGGIIMLGLTVSSISKFASELGSEKIIRRHIENSRVRTVGRTVTTSLELDRNGLRPLPRSEKDGTTDRPVISEPFDLHSRSTTIGFADADKDPLTATSRRTNTTRNLQRVASWAIRPPSLRPVRKPRLLLLREEKDRFDAMRRIQANTTRFKNWYALFLSVLAFGTLWCAGAAVFFVTERETQGLSYFQALYFCYVSLLTIGYGDLAPKSNAGRPFFVFWSLIAVPTMTILISDLGDTVISRFKQGTYRIADFTVLPREGAWREFLNRHPRLLNWIQDKKTAYEARKRLEEGFPTGPEPEVAKEPPTLDELAKEEDAPPTEKELARRLAGMIRKIAKDIKDQSSAGKSYSYEEWVEITQLIRFTAFDRKRSEEDADGDGQPDEGLIEWDWIGEDSPMMARGSEAEFVLDRLCESLNRYIRKLASEDSQIHKAVGIGDGKEDSSLRKRNTTREDENARSTDGKGGTAPVYRRSSGDE